MSERQALPPTKEYTPYSPNLIGLQSRLLLGGDAQNPTLRIEEPFNPTAIAPFEARSYAPFNNASLSERSMYWNQSGVITFTEQQQLWGDQLTQAFLTRTFSDSEKGFFTKLGISTDEFSSESAMNVYKRYFIDNDEPLKTFIEDAAMAHTDRETLTFSHEELGNNLDAIQWFAQIFGTKSSEIVTQLLDAEIKLLMEPEKFMEDPSRINNLSSKERELLEFLWQQHVEPVIDIPTTAYEIEESSTMEPAVIIEDQPEKVTLGEIRPYDVAGKLVDYRTGLVKNEKVDLLPYYAHFVDNVKSKFENNHPLFQDREPKLVLSDVAIAMIDNVASQANMIDKELAFALHGNNLVHEGGLVSTAAFLVPAMDFSNPKRSTATLDPDLHSSLATELTQNTNLIEYFTQSTGSDTGNLVGVLHIHQESLGDHWRIQPSSHDYQVAVNSIRNGNRPFFIWGVVTKSRGELAMRIFLSRPNQAGEVIHDEIPVLYEYDLDHVAPIAA